MTKSPVLSLTIFTLLASTVLAFMFDIQHIVYLAGSLGDQINYVNVARNLANYGHFIQHGKFEGSGNIIIPGLLTSENTRLYLPGFYLLLAGFFKLFGYSSAKAVIPNIAMYIAATLLTYYIGKKLYSERIGLFSALIFFILPFNVFTAFTCMGDIALPFVALLGFATLINTPHRLRPLTIPLLVGGAYLFRQTGLFLLIPMLGFFIDNNEKKTLYKVLFITAATVTFCHLLNTWQTHLGLAKIHFIDVLSLGHLNYSNAFPEVSNIKTLSSVDVISLVFRHTIDNIMSFFSSFHGVKPDINFLSEVSFFTMLTLFLIATIGAINYRKQEYFALSCCLFLVAVTAADIVYYFGTIRTLLRMVMISFPFVILQAIRFKPHKHSTVLFTLYCILSLYATHVGSHKLRQKQRYVQQFHEFMDKVNPPAHGLIACPTMFFRPYALDHYPQLMSFVPTNQKTLLLLHHKYPISTMVIAEQDIGKTVTKQNISEIGLRQTQKLAFWGTHYVVFKQ